MASFDIDLTSTIGKAIPNELTKTTSWTRFIPYIGQLLQILGAVDATATTYSDLYEANRDKGMSKEQARMNAFQPTMNTAMQSYAGGVNPGQYGSSGKVKRDWVDYVGQSGNIFSLLGGNMGLSSLGNIGGMVSSDIQGTPYTGGGFPLFDILKMFKFQ